MGYRHYFYKVSKKEVEAVKNMTLEEVIQYAKRQGVDVDEKDLFFYFNDKHFMNKVKIFEFGKLYYDDTSERIYNTGIPLFCKNEVQDVVSDYIPYVVGKGGLLEAIRIYSKKILNYYKDLLNDGVDLQYPLGITIHKDDIKSIDKVVAHIRDKIASLSWSDIADIDESKKWAVTDSWEYEHSIFNLVHILKSIDWEQDTILFYGW